MKSPFYNLLKASCMFILLSLAACGGGDGGGNPPAEPAANAVWNETNWDNMKWQ